MDSFENGSANTGQRLHLACRGLFLLSWLKYGELSIISHLACYNSRDPKRTYPTVAIKDVPIALSEESFFNGIPPLSNTHTKTR